MVDMIVPHPDEVTTVYAALEVSNSSWILGIGDPVDASRCSLHRLSAHDVAGVMEKIGQVRGRVSAGGTRAVLVYEAGYEGFWLARHLADEDIEVVVCDPASLEVVRRKRKVKTDRVDARKMVRALRAFDGGDRDALSRVRVPGVAEEDAKRLLRHRNGLVKRRIQLTNSIRSLLRLHGISEVEPARKGFGDSLDQLRTAYGTALLPGVLEQLRDSVEQLELISAQLKRVEQRRHEEVEASKAALNAAGEPDSNGLEARTAPRAGIPAALVRLRGIGENDAVLLHSEVLYRDFDNRRQLASYAGLAPVPWASGDVEHDQGISKAGSPLLRKHLVQMAWRWLRFQPDSALSRWFREYVSVRDGRSRKRAIVALARKLLVALWRYATAGLVPEGAVLSEA